MSGLSFRCRDLGFVCDFEAKGVATREEMVGIIKSHGARCNDLEAMTHEFETKVSKAIRGRPG